MLLKSKILQIQTHISQAILVPPALYSIAAICGQDEPETDQSFEKRSV